MKFNIANTVTVENFSLKNKEGGTTLSSHLQLTIPEINLLVVHVFDDYETGQRGWGIVKDIALMDDPINNYPNYPEFQKKSMSAKDAIKSIVEFFQENSSHIDDYERQEQLGKYQGLLNWTTAPMFKDNFLVFFSEFSVLTIER